MSCRIAGTLEIGDFMKNGREDAEVRGFAEDRMAAEAARNKAEQFRRLAEEAREVGDDHRGQCGRHQQR